MHTRALIPLIMLVLACVSTVTRAGWTQECTGTPAHIHQHGGSAHLHTHTESHNEHEHNPCDHACDDETHTDCCGHHDHHPEQLNTGLSPRERDLPTFAAGIVPSVSDSFRLPPREHLLRWAPLRQRPPDYLEALRTCVMLN